MKMTHLFSFLFVLLFLQFSLGKDIDKEYHESFDVKKGDVLHLEQGDGNVSITPWDKDILDIKVAYHAEIHSLIGDRDVEFNIEFSRKGNTIYVIEHKRVSGELHLGSYREREYRYTIRAPRYLILELECDDGDVNIEDWEGDIACNMDDGDLNLKNINSSEIELRIEDGDLVLKNINSALFIDSEDGDIEITECKTSEANIRVEDGDIEIRQGEGKFEIVTEDGDIQIESMRTTFLRIRGEDGDITVHLLKVPEIDLNVQSDDGDITIDAEYGISADISINTDDGPVDVDLVDPDDYEKGKHYFEGSMHGGKGKIKLRTNDGYVRLSESE